MKKTLAMIFAFLLTAYSMPYSPVSATEGKGDVNADGKFSTADIVSLQKWLLAESNTKLPTGRREIFQQTKSWTHKTFV